MTLRRAPAGEGSASAEPLRILLSVPVARDDFVDALAAIDGIHVEIADSPAAIHARIADCDVMVGAGGRPYFDADTARHLAASPRLRWLQLVSAGTEGLAAHGVPSRISLTSAGRGVSHAVAEHAVALAFALSRRLPDAWEQQRRGKWCREHRSLIRLLSGAHAVIVGLGRVGQELGRLCVPLGMIVTGVNRSGMAKAGMQTVVRAEQLQSVVGTADIVFLCLPEREATVGIFDHAMIRRMKRGAFLINVGRGSAVVREALVSALASGLLGGAAIDVTEPEPPEDDDPLWRTPGLIVTPHVAGAGNPQALRAMASAFVDNVDRFRRGEPLNDQFLLSEIIHADR